MMTKHTTILRRSIRHKDRWNYINEDEESGSVLEIYRMPDSIYDDFGQPQTVTITIELGDTLNE